MLFSLLVFGSIIASAVPKPQQRVVGGHDAEPHSAPYFVTIGVKFTPEDPAYTHMCGASILTPIWVLTAAHCMVPTIPEEWQLNMRAGVHDLREMDDTVQTRYIDEFHNYPDFIPGGASAFDIAVLKADEPFIFNEYVQPINLPPQGYISQGDSVIFGLGLIQRIPVDPYDPETPPSFPDILQTGILPIIPIDLCTEMIRAHQPAAPIHPTNLCTGPLDGSVSPCNTDSGGPIVQQVNGELVIIGIVSWGIGFCGAVNAPAVHMGVSHTVDWINSYIAE